MLIYSICNGSANVIAFVNFIIIEISVSMLKCFYLVLIRPKQVRLMGTVLVLLLGLMIAREEKPKSKLALGAFPAPVTSLCSCWSVVPVFVSWSLTSLNPGLFKCLLHVIICICSDVLQKTTNANLMVVLEAGDYQS